MIFFLFFFFGLYHVSFGQDLLQIQCAFSSESRLIYHALFLIVCMYHLLSKGEMGAFKVLVDIK